MFIVGKKAKRKTTMSHIPSLSALKKNVCYKNIPRGTKFYGKTKSKLSALELLGVYYIQGCEVKLEERKRQRQPRQPRSRASSRSRARRPRSSVANEVELKHQCNNTESSITLMDFDMDDIRSGIVTIKFPGRQKGECYVEKNLNEFWKMYTKDRTSMVFLWKTSNPSSIQKRQPLYKLPISGAWITKEAKKAIKKDKLVKLKKLNRRQHVIGSPTHWIGGVYGQVHTVYTV